AGDADAAAQAAEVHTNQAGRFMAGHLAAAATPTPHTPPALHGARR
ncbi:MAG: hypothetical protein RJA10_4214, partial [Pseudomonadota bacterium]